MAATRIRLATETDAVAIAAIYGPIVASTTISFETDPPDPAEMAHRIHDTLPVYPWLVCEHGGGVIGYAYASKHRVRAAYQWSVDVSVYVDQRCRRCGVARGLYQSIFAVLAEQGFVNAYAGIALPNAPSVALHESLGFTPIGTYRNVGYKLGAWRDVGWWQRALAPAKNEPRAIISVTVLSTAAGWDTLVSRGVPGIRPLPD